MVFDELASTILPTKAINPLVLNYVLAWNLNIDSKLDKFFVKGSASLNGVVTNS